MLLQAQTIIGGSIVTKHSKKGYNDSYELRISNNTLRWLLPQIKFYTEEKEIRRLALIEFLNKQKAGWNQTNTEERIEAIAILYSKITIAGKH